MRDRTDWRLSAGVFSALDAFWGLDDVDRFATNLTTHLHRFKSRWWCPGAEAIDIFSQSRGQVNNFTNPPFDLVEPVLDLIFEQDAAATVVLPVWQAQPFLLRTSTLASAFYLLRANCGLTTLGRIQPPGRRPQWRLAAFRLLPVGRVPLLNLDGGNRTPIWRVPHPSQSSKLLPSVGYATHR